MGHSVSHNCPLPHAVELCHLDFKRFQVPSSIAHHKLLQHIGCPFLHSCCGCQAPLICPLLGSIVPVLENLGFNQKLGNWKP